MKTEDEIYLELHDMAEPIIKRHADECAMADSIRTKWDDQLIEVQYMIIAAMIEFGKTYANQKLDEASEKANIIGDYWSNKCDECHFFDTENGVRMTVNKQ